MIFIQPSINPVVMSLGFIDVRWYSLAYIFAFILGSVIIKRLNKELLEMKNNPPLNCSAGPEDEDNLFKWTATIYGPEGSPYEAGIFILDIDFPSDYPFKPPKIIFKTNFCRFFLPKLVENPNKLHFSKPKVIHNFSSCLIHKIVCFLKTCSARTKFR